MITVTKTELGGTRGTLVNRTELLKHLEETYEGYEKSVAEVFVARYGVESSAHLFVLIDTGREFGIKHARGMWNKFYCID